jgi:ATP-binding cassette, subfamily B, bacterial MsbA
MSASVDKLLLKYAKKFPVPIALSVILSFSSALFSGVSTALIAPIILALLGKELNMKGLPPILSKPLSFLDNFSGDTRVWVMLGSVLFVIILKNGTTFFNFLVTSRLNRSVANTMRLDGLRLLLEVDWDFFTKNKIGRLLSYINQESGITAGLLKSSISMFTTCLNILVYLWFLLLISWQITIVATVLGAIVAVSNQFLVSKSKRLGKQLAKTSMEYAGKLQEILSGIRLVKLVNNEKAEFKKLKKLIERREKAQEQSQMYSHAIAPLNEVSSVIIVLAIVLVGRHFFADELKTGEALGKLLTYLLILFRTLPLIGKLNSERTKHASHVPSGDIIADFLQRDNKPFMKVGDLTYTKLMDSIRLENVSFAYPGSERQVLGGIDIEILKGQTVALVGYSGAGKSTIADLLPRFYDPTEGRIVVDGKDLRDYNLSSLHQAMGVVSQDTFLFNQTVRYNIAYGLPEATDAEILIAAKRANAHEFIDQLPDGLDTEIGDRGVMLSGGQRQRLAIARALLRNPDILILDEATSALDTVSERLVQEAIEELCRDRTTLVIAHRLSTIRKAHQIVVLEKGKVMEVGNHEELLSKQGLYYRLHEMQFGEIKEMGTNNDSDSLEYIDRVSYELRNDLNCLFGSIQLLSDSFVDNTEEQQELIDESYRSAVRLLKTIELYEGNGVSS